MTFQTVIVYIKIMNSSESQVSIPDERSMLGPNEDEEADSHQLLWGQQHILIIPRDALLQLCCPQLLIGGAVQKNNQKNNVIIVYLYFIKVTRPLYKDKDCDDFSDLF